MPLVSVVIPAYNCEEYIKKTLKSIISQTYTEIEIIVVNDGSTDKTSKIVKDMCKDYNIIKLVTQNNSGQATARNKGISLAKGEFIAFCDSDDEWAPNKLEMQIPLFNDSDVGLVYSDIHVLDDETNMEIDFKRPTSMQLRRGMVLKYLLKDNFVAHSSIIIRKSCFVKSGIFNENVKRSDDWDMLLRIAANFKFDYAEEKLIWYRTNRSGQISNNVIKRLDSKDQIFKNFLNSYNHLVSKSDVKLFFKEQHKSYSFFYRSKHPVKALFHSLKAISFSPTEIRLYRSLIINSIYLITFPLKILKQNNV